MFLGDLRSIERHRSLDNLTFLALRLGALMLFHRIDALDDYLVVTRKGADYLADLAFVIARQDDDQISFFYMH